MARRLAWSAWSLGAFLLVAWCVHFRGDLWRSVLLAFAVLLAGLAAQRLARLGEGARLTWNGQHWSCDGPTVLAGAVATIHLDFQSLMLIRLHEAGHGALWLWLERASSPARWLDVRRALHASSPAQQAPSQVLSSP